MVRMLKKNYCFDQPATESAAELSFTVTLSKGLLQRAFRNVNSI